MQNKPLQYETHQIIFCVSMKKYILKFVDVTRKILNSTFFSHCITGFTCRTLASQAQKKLFFFIRPCCKDTGY